MLSLKFFLKGKYLQVAAKKKKKGNLFAKAEASDEQITSSTFLNILNPTSYG